MKGSARWLSLALLLAPGAGVGQDPGQQTEPKVRGVLFYSPTCPHCREVMTETLPPVLGHYGDRLQLVIVNTATPGGEQLYKAAVTWVPIPAERIGVPTLVVGDSVLVGSYEIPNLLPGIVDAALDGTGIGWPDVPLIRQALAVQGIDTTRTAVTTGLAAEEETFGPEPAAHSTGSEAAGKQDAEIPAAETPAAQPVGAAPTADAAGEPGTGKVASEPGADDTPVPDSMLARAIDSDGRMALVHELSVRERLMLDPAGNGFAIAVLILMFVALALVAGDLAARIRVPSPPAWAIPTLTLVGIGVAAYLAFVEVTGAEAVCGPVGDCNTVQRSPYATIFGVPVGLVGVVGYAALLTMWVAGRALSGDRARLARRATWWVALGAVGFSLYLTALEPFVIGASCAWCLSSAVVTTLILVAATPERRRAVESTVGGPVAPGAPRGRLR